MIDLIYLEAIKVGRGITEDKNFEVLKLKSIFEYCKLRNICALGGNLKNFGVT